jgi:RNA polymerase sigma-70 factor (ECF subfamily)
MQMDPDERKLIDSAQKADPAAATQLIERFYERLYAFLRRLTHNDADAADLTQKTFTRVWQSLPGFAARSTLSSWMHGIAYHVYVDWRRSNHHTEARSEEWWATCVTDETSPAERVVKDDLARMLYRSVDELPPELRESIHLHYYQGLTLEETAETIGIASSTVKYRLRQAMNQLRRNLADPKPATGRFTTLRTL